MGKDNEPNWLPAAPGEFIPAMRIVWPKEPVIFGSSRPHSVHHAR